MAASSQSSNTWDVRSVMICVWVLFHDIFRFRRKKFRSSESDKLDLGCTLAQKESHAINLSYRRKINNYFSSIPFHRSVLSNSYLSMTLILIHTLLQLLLICWPKVPLIWFMLPIQQNHLWIYTDNNVINASYQAATARH
jgi:hypothetical protein